VFREKRASVHSCGFLKKIKLEKVGKSSGKYERGYVMTIEEGLNVKSAILGEVIIWMPGILM